ncbi:M15 family metallopeptidase [Paenibacillus athensensis]|uniref:M15 family metallopeptidase n=1 Tax=Paenibacillus athensensis TaxID=1967502 RepID=UPI001E54155A|nr:M15 family metallopeptidase [Paenibacillus athensensis]MCD1257319.1 M15 family metallopeptidase [Paenibacillus athensensis]
MRKRVLALAALALLGYGAIRHYAMEGRQPQPALSVHISATPEQTSGRALKVSADQIAQGNLLLVNKEHPVPKEAVTAASIVALSKHPEKQSGFVVLDNSIQLPSSLLNKFSAMVEAAGESGVNHFMVSSGYRDNKEQERLYRQMGADYAMPAGYSEHNLGLSVDIGSTQGEMSRAPEGKWLIEHAWEYGFILRYPKNKDDITGIQYEPWHFRYVGLPHSAIMQEKSWVLVEYLAYLREHRSLAITCEGRNYTVAYYPRSELADIRVPESRHYALSGDNMDGVIVTVYD